MNIFNLFVSGLISFIVSVKITPYIEIIRDYYISKDYAADSLTVPIALLQFTAFIAVGAIVYGIIAFIKFLLNMIK